MGLSELKINEHLLGKYTLEEYKTPLDRSTAMHFLRRITFHPTPEQLSSIIGKTAAEAFDILVGDSSESLPEATSSMKSWLNKLEEDPLSNLPNDIRFEIEGRHKSHYGEFIDWWLDLMKNDNFPASEKFTLFLSSIWSVEFTYDTLSLIPPPLLFRNNQTLRKNRIGSYKDIAKEITLDGSMLMYQSLFYSGKGSPNENFMRELMELFTMGIGDLQTGKSNYTEGDIREGARALTGWRTVAYLGQDGAPANRPFETFFMKNQHDTESKKLFQFGEISPINDDDNTEYLVKDKEVNGLIDILFTYKGESITRFICDKIIRFFVYSNPAASDLEIINELANLMLANDFELKPVYKKLFTSQLFFNEDFRASQIKTPPEYVIGLERMFDIDFDVLSGGYSRNAISKLEQVLYDPPNVSGWKGYPSWISTTTFPLRIEYSKELIDKLTDSQIIKFVKKFDNYSNPDLLNFDLISYLLPKSISSDRSTELFNILLNEISIAGWADAVNSSDNRAIQGIRNYLKRIILSPDFQLC